MESELDRTADQSPYRVIFFDLDGTLLPMDMDEFLHSYYRVLKEYVVSEGYDGEVFADALNAGVTAMATHEDGRLNANAFWDTFFSHADANALDWRRLIDEFYEVHFGTIGKDVVPNPAAAQIVQLLRDKGYPLVLATMPLFPERAVRWRLEWADINPQNFQRLTHYENSRSAKPKFSYYAENLAACGVLGSEVLMVGNNTVEDVAITELGADVYIITDLLIDPIGRDLSTIPHGTWEEFALWAAELPPCSNPVTSIDVRAISPEARDLALMVNGATSPAVAAEVERISQLSAESGD